MWKRICLNFKTSKLNCEVLYDDLAFEVRWAVAGDSIVLQLVSKLEDGEYMSFGISGDPNHSQMVGGDVAVAWVNQTTLKGFAVDYYLDAKSQCAGVRGSCPDERLVDGTNSIRTLNAALVNGYSIVTYQRSLKAADELDLPVLTNASQPIIWAVGPLNSNNEVSYHHHFTKGDKFIEFGRPPVWNCPMPEGDEERHEETEEQEQPVQKEPVEDKIKPNRVPPPKPVPKVTPWEIPPIQCNEPEDGVFYAQMGPTGGKQGYSAITGHVGWGISWYINGLLIPEIYVVRGRKYTFVTEGGMDTSQPARYHPFYITNDPVGGYFHKTEEEKQGVEIYAGVRRSRIGELRPTGVGRLCNWTPNKDGPESDEYPSFGAYQRSLTLICEQGDPGVITWIPDKHTPDTVYYQCFTHRHLGWKIHVVNECDAAVAEESRVVERVAAPDVFQDQPNQVHTRVKADTFLEHKRLEKIINSKLPYNNFSSDRHYGFFEDVPAQDPDHLGLEGFGVLPVGAGHIKDVINVVETIEDQMRRKNKPKPLAQYQVHEDVKEFLPEKPMREEDEYIVETGKMPQSYMLPPNQKPLTLQTVLRPNGPNGPKGYMGPLSFRRTPPELKLRKPLSRPQNDNIKSPYPLSMPMPPQKNKFINRGPPNGKRPPAYPGPLPNVQGKLTPHNIKTVLPQKPSFNYSPISPLKSQVQAGPIKSIIMGRPSPSNVQTVQTLNLGKSDIIANHVVKSQIMLPGISDVIVAQSSEPQISISRPGQIILGKPMENPVPLDQQMAPTGHIKRHPIEPASESPRPSSTPRIRLNLDVDSSLEDGMKSSDFMGQSVESTSLQPAVNTGFKPSSIVVESGFKPIIREPLMASEDRITNYGGGGANRRQDTDVDEDYTEPLQIIYTGGINRTQPPSETITQSFEPMFIPSPLDHHVDYNERQSGVPPRTTIENFPRNHAKDDRPYPFYVKEEIEKNDIFSKKNMEKEVPEMVMESDRVSPQYLPPDPNAGNAAQPITLSTGNVYTAYDGKAVSGATLVPVAASSLNTHSKIKLFSSKVPSVTEILLSKPQFGPFEGKIPTEVVEHINKEIKTGAVEVEQLKTEESKTHEVTNNDSNEKLIKTLGDVYDNRKNIYIKDRKYEEEVEDRIYEKEEDNPSFRRKKRESKATLFERGEVEEHVSPPVGVGMTKNQVEFDVDKTTVRNSATHAWSTNLLLLSLLLRL